MYTHNNFSHLIFDKDAKTFIGEKVLEKLEKHVEESIKQHLLF